MLEIKFFREHLKDVEASERKRGHALDNVHNVVMYDERWRNVLKNVEKARAERNRLNVETAKLAYQKKNVSVLVKKMKELSDEINLFQKKANDYLNKRDYYRVRVGNLLDKKVPKGKDATQNRTVRKVGSTKKFGFKHKDHIALGLDLDLFDFDKGADVAGARFVYFKNEAVVLDWALQMYGIETLVKNGFKMIFPPLMLNRKATNAAVDLGDFESAIYKIDGEDLYLIGSAELPIVNLHRNSTLDASELPILYGGISPCFRKEAGTHGKDDKGTMRMHQFNKAEQVIFCKQEDSDKYFDKLQGITEKFFKELGIPSRVVNICTGDIGDKQSIQYDIEAWFPGQNNGRGAYREVTSCSNCLSYQAVKTNTRYLENGEKKFVYMLNNTMVATSRAIPAILENHQQKDGSIKIPKCLWKYTNFKIIKPKV